MDSASKVPMEDNKDNHEHDIELDTEEEKDVVDTVEDLLMIQNKDILKRNLMTIVKENKKFNKRLKLLEERLKNDLPKADPSLSFQIDTEGLEDDEEQTISHITYSSGSQSSGKILGVSDSPPPAPEENISRTSCWNCSGSHNLSDCTEQKDFKRIAQNRKEFQSQKNTLLSSARYHEETGQKFGHLSPGGGPSEKLMAALGVSSDQLPGYIYRMRSLGYPPGWLKYAQIKQSGMSLYNHKGEATDNNETDVEDDKYDIDKLVSWPGFNSEIPKGYVDETNRFRVPPLNRCQSLIEMKRSLKGQEQKGYKKGKMHDVSTGDIDMNEDSESREEGELVDTSVDDDNNKNIPTTPIKQKIGSGSISETAVGTPVVDSYSPFIKLPEYNKFGVNMTEHIVFDNLPNATGNWDKMTDLLKNIRNKKEKDNSDDNVVIIEDD